LSDAANRGRVGRNAIYCKPQTIATLAEPRSGPTMIGPWTGDDASRAVKKDAPSWADTPEVSDRRRVRRNRHLSSERSNPGTG
jgi:hypothetical protein